jgi:hypothetical protein
MMKISLLIRLKDNVSTNTEEKQKETNQKSSPKKDIKKEEIEKLTIDEELDNFDKIPNLSKEEEGELQFLRALYEIDKIKS